MMGRFVWIVVLQALVFIGISIDGADALAAPTSSNASRRSFLNRAAAVTTASFFVPAVAGAYERRDVGGDKPSADTAALNEQAYRTNNRLESQGFKLDTREEEAKRLSDAMKSFSYDSNSSSGNNGKKGSGYQSK